MPVRHKASPFWAQAVKRNMYIGFACNFTFLSDLAKGVEISKKCIPVMMVFPFFSFGFFPLAMVPSLCIDKKVGFDSPRCAVSLPKIGIGQMDSKQEFFAPSDVQVNLQCAMLISTAGYTHSMTKVAIHLFIYQVWPALPLPPECNVKYRGSPSCGTWTGPFRITLNTSYIAGLDMCECTEAVHSVALGTGVTSQVWTV